MKLIGLYDSPFVRRVAISLKVQGFAYEHVPLSVFRNYEDFKAYNPLVKAPTLMLSDGQVITESDYILDYLDERVPERRLVPASGPARMAALQTIATAIVAAEKSVALVYETQLRPKQLHHQPLIDRFTGQLNAAIDLLESKFPGGAMTSAHLDQAAITSAVAYRFISHHQPDCLLHGKHPRLAALSSQCEQLPAFLAVPFM
jgi:glutathione S-transferase